MAEELPVSLIYYKKHGKKVSVLNEAMITVQELANTLRVSADEVYELVREGKIPFKAVGKNIRFTKSVIDNWLNEL